jgi:hypothetical protein
MVVRFPVGILVSSIVIEVHVCGSDMSASLRRCYGESSVIWRGVGVMERI